MHIVLASDLHLCASRPEKLARFEALTRYCAASADALYLLGDVFEYWLGDDDDTPPHDTAIRALARLTGSGTPVYVMRGNRDFLLGERFADASGCTLLDDPCIVELCGARVLLMHGDLLCTLDVDYQALRRTVNDPSWQQMVLAKPLAERRSLAERMRYSSDAAKQAKPEAIMDVEPATVERYLREAGVSQLIHGHTHRPGVHRLTVDGVPAVRTVLGDWYRDCEVLSCTPDGARLMPVEQLLGAEAATA